MARMNEAREEVDFRTYRAAYCFAETQGYSDKSSELFAHYHLARHTDSGDEGAHWSALNDSLAAWEEYQAGIGR